MTNPLLISRKENAGILRKICSEIGATPREISGDEWSLALFIKTDLKNYMYQSHYVLDVSAFLEKGDDLVALCEGIALQKDPNSIIIYADHFFPPATRLPARHAPPAIQYPITRRLVVP